MASFAAAKRTVYRLQTLRLEPPNYPNAATRTEHHLCLTSNVNVCIKNIQKYIWLYQKNVLTLQPEVITETHANAAYQSQTGPRAGFLYAGYRGL